MRIAYVIWSLGLGGAEQVVMQLASHAKRRGHEPFIVTLNDAGPFAGRMTEQGIEVIALEKRSRYDLRILWRLARLFRSRRVDVVHAHLWGGNCWGRVAARLAGVPTVIVTEHNVDTWKRWPELLCDRLLAPWATTLVAVSEQVRAFYEARGIGRGRWRVVYNGIDTERLIGRRRGEAYRALGLPDGAPVIGLIGRLVPAKCPLVFLDAFERAAREIPNLRALIVGDGPLRAALERAIRDRGLRDRAIVTGLRHDVPELLGGLDALAFSSEREGLSMAMLEAMAAGVPVVATAVGGTPELIEDGVSGVLVPPHQPSALADALVHVLRRPGEADALRRAARLRVEQRFALSTMLDAHEQLYAPRTSSRPVRVMYVIDHLGLGGAQRQLVELVRRLPKDQWQPVVVSLSAKHTALMPELVEAGAPVHVLDHHGKADLRCLWRLVQLIRGVRPAIVHTWLFTADCYGRVAAWFGRTPHTICAIRNTIDDMPAHHRTVNRWLTRYTCCMTVNADAIREGLIRDGGIPAQKIRTIHNGIDLTHYPPMPRDGRYRAEWGMPDDARVVAMVGRLAPQKDHWTLLQAMRRVMAQADDAYLVLIGDGSLRRDVARWVDELGLAARTRLLGARRDVWPILHQVDLCVLSSHYEGCSNAVMEAMAAGRPVVATNVGGNRELVDDGHTGWLVAPGDPDALASAILRALRDPEQAETMGAYGRLRIMRHFAIDQTATKTQDLYRELLAGQVTGN